MKILSRSEMKMIKGGGGPEFLGYQCCNDQDPSRCTSCQNHQLQCTGVQCPDGWSCKGLSHCDGSDDLEVG
jgi:hypothetical protein